MLVANSLRPETMDAHREDVLEQFSQQAALFAAAAPVRDETSLNMLVQSSGVTAEDSVLDVACGPGIVGCAFARIARQVAGIDVTPAMIELARGHAAQLELANTEWQIGEIPPLPWADGAFTVVVSRYSFHHVAEPLTVLKEMARVCKAGGTVVVCDLALPAQNVDAFNDVERLRDVSHVRALTLRQLSELFMQAGLAEPRVTGYRLQLELHSHLSRSFPAPGAEAKIRDAFSDSLAGDALGVHACRDGETISYSYPVAVLAATV
jgi:ubiquinone/menaquinone biosynthesis C-methylase UbiE